MLVLGMSNRCRKGLNGLKKSTIKFIWAVGIVKLSCTFAFP